jgi:hypothetical protein
MGLKPARSLLLASVPKPSALLKPDNLPQLGQKIISMTGCPFFSQSNAEYSTDPSTFDVMQGQVGQQAWCSVGEHP